MPKSNNGTNPSRQIQESQPYPANPIIPNQSQRLPSSMEAAGDWLDLSDLTFRQQAALPVIAASPSLSQATRSAGIDENTLRRWLREPVFADRLAAFRQQSAVIAREELNALARRGMAVFAEAMSDPNPAIRLRAARYALSYTVQFGELHHLGASLEELKQLLSQAKPGENVGK